MESKDRLIELDADRASLANRVTTPWWLPAGFGLIAATYVVTPAFDGRATGVIIAAIVMSIVLVAAYHRVIGMKIGRVGAVAWILLGAGVLVTLGLYSVSLALASFRAYGWIVVPAIAAFALGAALTVLFTTAARERIRNVR